MDFDEEMYAPLPDELEWLENAANFPPDEEYPDEDDDLLELSGEPPEEDPADPDSRKRRRPGDAEVPGDTEKRSKGCGEDGEGAERDEDWLRYSPRKGEDVVAEVVEEKMVSRFASEIDGDFVPVTGLDGDRVYVKACSGLGEAGGRCGRLEMPSRGLLSESIEVLMDRLNDEAIQKALQESFGTPSCSLDSTGMMVNERLWVDKYAPKSFLDLLSDEQTNREVLLWLKQWDSSVFGSEIRTTADDVLSSLRRHSSIVQPQKNFDRRIFSMNGRNSFNSKISEQSNDPKNNYELSKEAAGSLTKKTASSPPEHKVLLLCGPPGLGKTTLAHVAAKHCGYRVVEINASDERSSSTIESKILDAVQMNSVMTDSKPKCLVIDEIDGALREGKGAVEVILKMISAEKKSNTEPSHSESTAGKVHSKRRRKTVTLSRPVICICNDLYSPVLRPLRQVAKVHTFVQPTINRVVNRLRFICGKEGFRTSSVALSALAECTECDIRSCLNTLQFLHRKKENLNILDIHSQVVGRKDVSRTAFDVWKEVLQQRKQKRGKLENFSGNLGGFEFLYNLLSNRGEYELTMDGIYENFLQLSYHDPALCKTVGCLDVLGISDSLNKFVLRTQHMSLHAYQPFVAICAKNLVAQVEKPHIEWPRSLQRCRTILIEKNDLFKCWHNNLSPSISRHLSMESFVQDVLSPLLHILNPPTLRPVALHLLSEKEKENLSELVNTMVSYSVTYKSSVPESMPKAQRYNASSDITSLTLYPPIDNFINFKDHQIQLYELSSSVKHMLLHEVEKQKILCESIGRSADANDENNRNQVLSHRSVTKEITKNELQKNKHVPDSSQISAAGTKSRDAGNSRKTARHPSSFFDRFRKKSNDAENPESSSFLKPTTFERDQRPFLLKYNEGFTNAIKRPVRMRELLQ